MKYPKIPIFFLAAAMSSSTLVVADDDDELEFDEAQLYFELNDTDGDLGIHGKVDGDAWKWVAIENPSGRRVVYILTRSGFRRQGLTELFFESAEPCFPDNPECEDPLSPTTFFNRFPEGWYEYEGRTIEWEEIEGEVYLSQRIPAAPVISSVGDEVSLTGEPLGECWNPGDVDEVVISWLPVTTTHASLGSDTGEPLGDNSVIYYEFVAEIDGTELKSTALIPPETNSWTVPEEFINLTVGLMVEDEDTGMEVPVEEIKFEIIVRVSDGQDVDDDGEERDPSPGNQSAVESCFDL